MGRGLACQQAEAMVADGALQIVVHRVNEWFFGTHKLAHAEVPRRNNVSATHRMLEQQQRPALDGFALERLAFIGLQKIPKAPSCRRVAPPSQQTFKFKRHICGHRTQSRT